MHLNLPIELLYLSKKPHQNPLGSFKDLNIHRESGQTVGSDFAFNYVVIIIFIKI
jgi:hypothetical protein